MFIKDHLQAHLEVAEKMFALQPVIEKAGAACLKAVQQGKKVILAGNGGSAADSQHIAAEFTGRFVRERVSLPAIALTTDTSALTAIGNDYGYDAVFSRQLEGLGQDGDVFIGISTSGNSRNLLTALGVAKAKGMFTIGLLGRDGGKMRDLVNLPVVIPSEVTARIQEMHILVGHLICEFVDQAYA